MSQFIKIDSSLRNSPTTNFPSNCTIPSQEVLHGTYSLKAMSLGVTYYNVNSTNNMVYFTDTGGARTCALTPQYYISMAALATNLATAMNSVGSGTVSVTASASTLRLTITNTVAFSMTFGTNTLNSASIILGFVGNSAGAAITQIGTQSANLSTTLSYNFQLSNSTSELRTLDGKQFTFCIPALTTTPACCYYEPSVAFPIVFRIDSTRNLGVKIFDDQFRILNNMTADFYMILSRISD